MYMISARAAAVFCGLKTPVGSSIAVPPAINSRPKFKPAEPAAIDTLRRLLIVVFAIVYMICCTKGLVVDVRLATSAQTPRLPNRDQEQLEVVQFGSIGGTVSSGDKKAVLRM